MFIQHPTGWGKLGLDETTSRTMATSTSSRGAAREGPNAAATRKGANYTSLNLQSYKGARPDGKGFGAYAREVLNVKL